MLSFIRTLLRNKKGAAMVEYGLVVAGVALVTAAATSVLGHKTNDLFATMATVLPGAHADDNGPIASGRMIETAPDANGVIALDAAGIQGASNTARLETNLGIAAGTLGALVVDVPAETTP